MASSRFEQPDTSAPGRPRRKVYIDTLGCQMNKNDSELMLGLLAPYGFDQTLDKTQADLVILNTCQIRANAEDKAFCTLQNWKALKHANPQVKIAMGGCVAQQVKDEVFDKVPLVDIVFGTQNIQDLPRLVEEAFRKTARFSAPKTARRHKVLAADKQKPQSTYAYFDHITPVRQSQVSAWITIIEGCDYFCTYCVVPYTRGRQISRPAASILEEVRQVEQQGYREITLLGQTVDSYGKDLAPGYGLAELLYDLHETCPGIDRIRFMTSHPLDLGESIIQAVADLPRVMEYIHVPMQSGSTAVLDRMRRGYSRQDYFELTDRIRQVVPGCGLSGDFIVGFPGETEAQFEETLSAVRRVGFDLANTAVYSARQQTPAGLWEGRGEGTVSDDVKAERLQVLNDVVAQEAMRRNTVLVGQVVEVLVEGPSQRQRYQHRWRGRTRTNKVVNFDSSHPTADLTGQLLAVRIDQAGPFALQGHHNHEAPDRLETPDYMFLAPLGQGGSAGPVPGGDRLLADPVLAT
ncbi:MAG: tRNA (N6-isopentenyl adenosine(37)-C2)-methylthiotransferase MiaB [Cyanobacteria bacterium HKST-UBA06]|nr:tRNA (N6-isopentenyl adenosine(37)-C2)-methylthiotransferase MiaB [Cyanobacteria bacterium HKST-UBA06]